MEILFYSVSLCVLMRVYCTVYSLMCMLTCQYMRALQCMGVYMYAYTPGMCVTAKIISTLQYSLNHGTSRASQEGGPDLGKDQNSRLGALSTAWLTAMEPGATHSRQQDLAGEGATRLLSWPQGFTAGPNLRCSGQPGTDCEPGLCCSLVVRI